MAEEKKKLAEEGLKQVSLEELKPVLKLEFEDNTSPSGTIVLIGTFRFDAYDKNNTSVYSEIINVMGQKKWDDSELDYWPWFSKVDSHGNLVEMHENTREIMEQENEMAHNAGIDYWVFLKGLDEQYRRYQESSNKNLMRFGWVCNGIFDSDIWKKEKSELIASMKDARYVKVLTERPLLYVISYKTDGAAVHINDFRSAVQEAGLPNPYIVAVYKFNLGEDAHSVYWPKEGCTAEGQSYKDFIKNVSAHWSAMEGEIVPWTPMNTDARPYAERPPSWWKNPPYIWTHPPTPEEFAEMVQKGVDFVKVNPQKCPAHTIIIKEWNGPEESGLVLPGRHHGANKLNGLKKVNKSVLT